MNARTFHVTLSPGEGSRIVASVPALKAFLTAQTIFALGKADDLRRGRDVEVTAMTLGADAFRLRP